jgi:hypothetical protein
MTTESNFDLDLQDHFLTSFHNGMKDFAKELDKNREVKVFDVVKNLSKEDVKRNIQSFYDYIDSTHSLRNVIDMDRSWITSGASKGDSMLSFVTFTEIETIITPKSEAGIWKYLQLFLLLSIQYLQIESDAVTELSNLLKPSKTPKKAKSSSVQKKKIDMESLRNDPFLRKLEESRIGKMAKELAQSMNFEDLAKQLGGGLDASGSSNPISAMMENITKNPEILKSMIGKIGETVKSQLSKSEIQGDELKEEVQDIMSSLKDSSVVSGIMENIGPLAGNASNPMNIVKGVVSSLTKANASSEGELGSIESLSDDLEQMWKGGGETDADQDAN